MLAVRYLTLTALVVWLGGMVTLRLLVSRASELWRHFQYVEYGAGAIMLLGLFVLKFVGPPPRAFVPRAAVVVAMLAAAAYSAAWDPTSAAPGTVDLVLGFVLLFWYVQE